MYLNVTYNKPHRLTKCFLWRIYIIDPQQKPHDTFVLIKLYMVQILHTCRNPEGRRTRECSRQTCTAQDKPSPMTAPKCQCEQLHLDQFHRFLCYNITHFSWQKNQTKETSTCHADSPKSPQINQTVKY